MNKFLVIAAGGALGAVLRYIVSGAAYQLWGSSFPWGTLTVNLIGCFLIGLLSETFTGLIVPQHLKTMALIGMLGAFTTFSTFGLETVNLMRDGEWRLVTLNLVLSNLLGIVHVIAGLWVARIFLNFFK